MRTVERKPAKGSRRWLQEAVSARSAMSGVLDERILQVCDLPARVEIKWRSPREEDAYAEYGGDDFLVLLELRLEHRPPRILLAELYCYVHEVFIDVAERKTVV